MGTSAIVMMIIAMVTVWGGLAPRSCICASTRTRTSTDPRGHTSRAGRLLRETPRFAVPGANPAEVVVRPEPHPNLGEGIQEPHPRLGEDIPEPRPRLGGTIRDRCRTRWLRTRRLVRVDVSELSVGAAERPS
ncbi:methionine/alanine import family NSS transporter small subunit [Brevibacterium casei]|nr:methionine/alanine import family NSS transporter small subunit [Brevibacterium casei]